MLSSISSNALKCTAVADPGFREGAYVGANLLLDQYSPINSMKMKNFWPRGGGASLSPSRSATGTGICNNGSKTGK